MLECGRGSYGANYGAAPTQVQLRYLTQLTRLELKGHLHEVDEEFCGLPAGVQDPFGERGESHWSQTRT